MVSLKGVTEAVCGLKCVDLSYETIKILEYISLTTKNFKCKIIFSLYKKKKYRKFFFRGIHVRLILRGEL